MFLLALRLSCVLYRGSLYVDSLYRGSLYVDSLYYKQGGY
jgi:hypothetical protein